MKLIYLLFFIILSQAISAQQDSISRLKPIDSLEKTKPVDSIVPLKRIKEKVVDSLLGPQTIEDIVREDYKIVSHYRDTTFLDTTLTIKKEYKYNYLRKDNFELMPFGNIGQPYNKLGVNFESKTMYPSLGATAKHYNYQEIEDITYYNVPIPMAEILFKTTFEQGQLLDANLTFNTSRQLNFSIGYKGFRSLGKYNSEQAESSNFKVTGNYETKDKRYNLRMHIAAQDVIGEENGGLLLKEEQFESKDDNFTNRIRIDTRLSEANNKILGKRYYLDHQYKLLRKQKDSSKTAETYISLGHQYTYETKLYQFNHTSASVDDLSFGNSFLPIINDEARLKTTFNQVSATFYNLTLGKLKGFVNLYSYNYFFDSLLTTDDGPITNQLKGEEIAVGANYKKQIGGFKIEGEGSYSVSGELSGNILDASASYNLNENNKLKAVLHTSSKMPNFNYLLYQSEYENYNWQNTANFKKQNVNSLQFSLHSKVWGDLIAKYATIDNYTYFGAQSDSITIADRLENETVKPFQEGNNVNHLKVKYIKEFKVGKFALANTVMYQNVSQTNTVLNVPDLVTRNTLYFSDEIFKKAMYLQTGITFKYFTSYNMDAYNPLLGEFYIQNNEKIGGFPLLDFFINARVKQTRIYLKAEHFNSSFSSESKFYSAPDYPFRDFVIRFGLVWNFFS